MTTAVNFNEEYKVLTDEMGIPLAHSTVAWLVDKALEHMQHNALEMEAIAQRLVRENAPSMSSQMNWDYFTEGFDAKSGRAGMKAYLEGEHGPAQKQ